MGKQLKLRQPNHATVVAYLALFIALGGSAYAVSHLGKNSVGAKQLKKNAVTTAKITKEAVTSAKVKKDTLTGTQINASTLGTVPSAQVAQTTDALSPPEPWHVVGAPGEPGFESGWESASIPVDSSIAFYKDHEGVVHLRGVATGGLAAGAVFQLPPGFRPASGKIFSSPVPCSGTAGTCNSIGLGSIFIAGSGLSGEGGVLVAPGTTGVTLDSISFRAES
jgi:hypothetical protein